MELLLEVREEMIKQISELSDSGNGSYMLEAMRMAQIKMLRIVEDKIIEPRFNG